jgi:hypothetical protein
MTTAYVKSVTPKGRGWLIRLVGEDHLKDYRTTNAFKASICQRAMERGKQVRVWGGGGWYYREMDTVREVADAAVEA